MRRGKGRTIRGATRRKAGESTRSAARFKHVGRAALRPAALAAKDPLARAAQAQDEGSRLRSFVQGELKDLRARVKTGLPFTAFDEVSAAAEIRPSDLAALLTIPPRTIARRKKEGRLHPEESDKLLRLGRIVVLAEETLGTYQKASGWLKKGNRALGGDSPLTYLDTDVGAREVEGLLLRISHGTYS